MSAVCSFFVPGKPEWLRRHRTTVRNGKPIMFDPPQNREAKRLIQQYARLAMAGSDWPLDGPLSVSLTFNVFRPKSSKREWPSVKPDIDNYIKLVLDALNGFVWRDDCQVVKIDATKWYTTNSAGTSVIVKRITENSPSCHAGGS